MAAVLAAPRGGGIGCRHGNRPTAPWPAAGHSGPRGAARYPAPALALLLAARCRPRAQQGDWRAAAPALALEGAVRPLDAPVAIGGAAWGPWRSLCREQAARPGRPMQRDCLAVAEARPEGGGVRLTLVQDQLGLRISALRDDDGRVDGIRRAARRRRPRRRRMPRATGCWRPGATSSPRSAWSAGASPRARTWRCRSADRRAAAPAGPRAPRRIGGRPVLVARCAVELAGRLRGGESEARVAIFARVAIDIATGMVAAQGYATRIETFGAGGRSNGVVVTPSRVVLE